MNVWLDVLKLIAIFMVICVHCSDPSTCHPKPGQTQTRASGAVYMAHFSDHVYLYL